MKRDFVNSPQLNGSMENSKVNHKYCSLLEDYLELQKEHVSKKKKLQVESRSERSLWTKFLRQRHKHLTRSQFAMVESEPGPHQKADIGDVPLSKQRKNYKVNQSNIEREGKGREQLKWKLTSVGKKPKNFIISEKRRKVERGEYHSMANLNV